MRPGSRAYTGTRAYNLQVRQQLANLFWLSALSGCSLIYNPNNLDDPKADAGIDATPIDSPFIDANPTNLGLTELAPEVIDEGQGDGGSPPGVLVVYGHDILGTATIELVSADPNVQVTIVGDPVVARDANSIAVVVKVDVNPMATTSEFTDVTVTVKQNSGDIEMTLPTPWKVRNLPELAAADIVDSKLPAMLAPLYSRVDLTGVAVGEDGLLPGGPGPVFIRSVTDIVIPVELQASAPFVYDETADRRTPGPGGAAGGDRNGGGAGTGGAPTPTGNGKGGGGGGYAGPGEAGTGGGAGGAEHGERFIRLYEENTSGGGAGGRDGTGIGTIQAGVGGGSGGLVELTAGGNLQVGSIAADGASGADGSPNGGVLTTAGGGGGGGAGGRVVLRAGGTFMVGAVSVAGGTKGAGGINSAGALGTAGTPGGDGADGRARYDTQDAGASISGATRGFYVVPPTKRIYDEAAPTLMVRGQAMTTFFFRVLDGLGDATASPVQTLGSVTGTFNPVLGIGYNRVCVIAEGGSSDNDEATNCVTIVGMPTGG